MTPREARRAMKSYRTRFILVFTRSDFRRVFGENPFFDSFRLDAQCDGEFELPPPFRSCDSKRQVLDESNGERPGTCRPRRRADRPAESMPQASKRRC
jgi:hypothetical protein